MPNEYLVGKYKHSIDDKGRTFIPSKLRDAVGVEFMLTKSIFGKHCLCIYSMEGFKALDEHLRSFPISQIGDVVDYLYAGTVKVTSDSQGRILIPQELRSFANLGDEVLFVGAASRLDVWNPDDWEQSQSKTPEQIGAIIKELGF